jgi:hypothetical protein
LPRTRRRAPRRWADVGKVDGAAHELDVVASPRAPGKIWSLAYKRKKESKSERQRDMVERVGNARDVAGHATESGLEPNSLSSARETKRLRRCASGG